MISHFTSKHWVPGLTLLLLCSLGGTAWAQTTTPAKRPTTRPNQLVTTFACVQTNTGYATVARRGTRTTPPMINWTKAAGGFTAQQRCDIVSERLTRAVAASGTKFRDLQLTYGKVNREFVICHVGSQRGACNAGNILLTLPKATDAVAKQNLEKLVNFGIQGSGTALQQSGPRYYAPIGDAIEKFFAEPTPPATATPSSPENPVSPVAPTKSTVPAGSTDNSI